MSDLPPIAITVLAERLAECTRGDEREIAVTLKAAGDRLPQVIADLMLKDLRARVGQGGPTKEAVDELNLPAVLARQLRRTSRGAGASVTTQQQARVEAEQLFSVATDVVEPFALVNRLPDALQREDDVKVTTALESLHALTTDSRPRPKTLHRWMAEARRLSGLEPADQARSRAQLAAEIDETLRKAAGDTAHLHYDPTRRDRTEVLRDGIALGYAQRVKPEFAEYLGLAEVVGHRDVQLAERFEARMVEGICQEAAERLGRSEQGLLDQMVISGDPDRQYSDQWHAVSRILVTDDELEGAENVEPERARAAVVEAMWAQYDEYYNNLERTPSTTPRATGASIAAAGFRVAEEMGVRVGPQTGGGSGTAVRGVGESRTGAENDGAAALRLASDGVPGAWSRNEVSEPADEINVDQIPWRTSDIRKPNGRSDRGTGK